MTSKCHVINRQRKKQKGSFNNYVDQILPNFDPFPLEWTIVDILHDTYPGP
jgi:hypothetical protein